MKDINFRDTVQFGIWKYLDEVNGVVVPQYSCAQPITNGVRLGNGNDTIADVGECGVTPPSISCDGATTTILIPDFIGQYFFTLNSLALTTASAEEFKTIIDEDPELNLLFTVSTADGSLQITNISSEYQRFGLLPFEPSNPSMGAPQLNPTADIDEFGQLTFCLSPAI